jgi:hypothetical protein
LYCVCSFVWYVMLQLLNNFGTARVSGRWLLLFLVSAVRYSCEVYVPVLGVRFAVDGHCCLASNSWPLETKGITAHFLCSRGQEDSLCVIVPVVPTAGVYDTLVCCVCLSVMARDTSLTLFYVSSSVVNFNFTGRPSN